jgi:hypothetical protein
VKAPDPKRDFLSPAESMQLLATERDPEKRALLLFALRTGARAGEQLALEWGDIDFANKQVVLRRSMALGLVVPTKSGRERRVPLTDEPSPRSRLRRLGEGRVRGVRHSSPVGSSCVQQVGKEENTMHIPGRTTLRFMLAMAGVALLLTGANATTPDRTGQPPPHSSAATSPVEITSREGCRAGCDATADACVAACEGSSRPGHCFAACFIQYRECTIACDNQ